MKKITSLWQIAVLNAYWVGLSFKWNAIHPIVLPAMLLNFVPVEFKNTYLGVLTFAGLVIAAFVQPVAGAVSDNWRSRWGRRRPFIVAATLLEFIFLIMIALAGSVEPGAVQGLWLIAVGYLMLQFISNIGQGPAQALLPDRVDPHRLGVASGFKTFLDMFALIIASLAAGRMLDPQGRHPELIFGVMVGLMLVSTSITVFGTKEERSDIGHAEKSSPGLRDQLHIDFKKNRVYWWVILQRFAFMMGIFGVEAFAQYYMSDVLEVANPVQATGDLLAALTVALVVLALTGGWLADRFGVKRILLVAGVLGVAGLLLLRLAPTPQMLVLFGSVLGAGIGLFLTASWALANKLAPPDEAGKYLGLTNLATAGAGALARLEGPLIDWGNAAAPGMWLGYTGLFVFGAACVLISVLLLKKIPER